MIDIDSLTSNSILEPEIFATLLDTENQIDYVELEESLEKRAKELGVLTSFKKYLSAYKKELKKINASTQTQQIPEAYQSINLIYTNEGKVKSCIENFYKILNHNDYFRGKIVYNEIKKVPEKLIEGEYVNWSDTDDSRMRKYIESNYGIHSEQKLKDAFQITSMENAYNPIKNIIEAVEWDGKGRVFNMLHKWLKAEDNAYTREVSRLIFAGAINRLYNPGCKFDEVPVLVGINQGEGKSTFVQCLALDEKYFAEVKEIEGTRSIEAVQGAWICEIAELLALTKAKEVEAVKAYISVRVDKWRKAYAKHVTSEPRQCIFIGTTNKREFLTDKTGNRRFYPVEVHSVAKDLYNNMDELMNDILQAYAEALLLYKKDLLKPFLDEGIKEIAKEKQQESLEEDSRVGIIENYLMGKYVTCVRDLWHNALKLSIEPTRKDSNDICLIMDHMPGWKKNKTPKRFSNYGLQRYWERIIPEKKEGKPKIIYKPDKDGKYPF